MRERPTWMIYGNCVGLAPATFYPSPHDLTGELMAKAICAECPVLSPCRTYALDNDESGVWGMTSEAERRAMTKRTKKLLRAQ